MGSRETYLEIFDLKGTRVFSERVLPGQEIDFSGSSSGVFLYRLTDEEKITTGKILR
jgi:hypothetical protein